MQVPFMTSRTMILTGGTIVILGCFLAWQIKSTLTCNNMALTARTVMVTGASRGLGLEYIKQLVKLPSPPEVVLAACRDPASATNLQNFAKGNPSVKVIKMDVGKDEDIKSAFQEAKNLLGDKGLNLLINNAAIYDQTDAGKLTQVTRERMQKHFDINVSGPLMVSQTFLPLLQQAAKEGSDSKLSCSRAGIIMMTSHMGSQGVTFSDGAGEAFHYKCSKTALTMAAVMMSRELKDSGIFVAAIHPGWVKTDMGSDYAPTTPDQSVQAVLKVLGSAGEDMHGKLVTYEGKELPY